MMLNISGSSSVPSSLHLSCMFPLFWNYYEKEKNWERKKSKKSFLSSKIRLRISRSIANPKPGFYNLNPDFPIERTLS